MTYLKHNNSGKGKRPTKTAKDAPVPADPVEADMSGIEVELANIARSIRAYVANAANAENSLALFTGSAAGGYSPMRLELEGDAVEAIADSLSRIADALAGRVINSSHAGTESPDRVDSAAGR